MFQDVGGGGKITQLQAPHYVKAGGASYWMHPNAKFKGKPKNIIRRDKPISYNGDPNPFNHGREIYGTDYCKFCNKWYDQDACPDHHIVMMKENWNTLTEVKQNLKIPIVGVNKYIVTKIINSKL